MSQLYLVSWSQSLPILSKVTSFVSGGRHWAANLSMKTGQSVQAQKGEKSDLTEFLKTNDLMGGKGGEGNGESKKQIADHYLLFLGILALSTMAPLSPL